ncbi:oxidoreductase [Bifidobacterium aemilianum]|uniref:Oxidoreductase n=1 Tax=Bifidobacterium aemilianum TaxID=2493120 RepID=A0A366KD86_9BIFI|nr:Gfo/Idh/MocA family oxidoreductase [Bifidobacterium aemilianum]RBP98631.1 oxidoreductase [Bifidobacterium aemilianum]
MSTMNGKGMKALEEGKLVKLAILGAGRIARTMAETLIKMQADDRYSKLVSLYAVAARDKGRADQFAARYGIPVAYGSYEELVADPQVDLVYIATPHNLHAEQGRLCLEAGKNILVEKSFTANRPQAEQLLAVAKKSGLLCTEAIWTRYMPSRTLINDLLNSGVIGQVKAIDANLCYPVTGKARMTDPALAGGALLDVGVYPLNFIDMIMGGSTPERIETSMQAYETGVDAQSSITLYYEGGIMAVSSCSMLTASDRRGSIWGTEGYMVCKNVNNVESINIYDQNHQLKRRVPVPDQLTGYEYEVAAAAQAILDGRSECPEMPHDDTLRIMGLMDRIRADWKLTYPFE